MQILDGIIFVLLIVGNILALAIWWWLLVAPVARVSSWCARQLKRSRPEATQIQASRTDAREDTVQ